MFKASVVGTVDITASIVLMFVLYIPKFKFNLVSIPKFIHDTKGSLTFTGTTCMIQDHKKWILGSGSLHCGFYHLDMKAVDTTASNNKKL